MLKTLRKKLIMFRESTAMALDNIRSNKVRSFLTLLGIMIGVMAVITLISTDRRYGGHYPDIHGVRRVRNDLFLLFRHGCRHPDSERDRQ